MDNMSKASTLLAAFLLLCVHPSYATPSLSMKLSGESNVVDVNDLAVTVNVTNTGDESLKLYKDPRGVLSSFPENTFSISSVDGDDHPDFVGARVKYGFDTATEFVTLEPGSSVTVNHDLSEAYKFSKAGDYKIEASSLFFYQDSSNSPAPISASVSTPHQAKVSGNLVSRALVKRSLKYATRSNEIKGISHRDAESSTLERRATFTACDDSQQSMIAEALPYTVSYIEDSIRALDATTSSGNTRYETWFGAFSEARKLTVCNHFTAIQQHDVTSYTYDCGCTRDVYAYVYPDIPGVVHLCTVFWSALTTGKDSKAGTIIHEASHFTVNGDTDDIVYGQTRAMELALSNPDDAIRNADNHEYYAENTV